MENPYESPKEQGAMMSTGLGFLDLLLVGSMCFVCGVGISAYTLYEKLMKAGVMPSMFVWHVLFLASYAPILVLAVYTVHKFNKNSSQEDEEPQP